jgi:hypothetical protein
MAIQTNQLPLSPSSNEALAALLRHPGYQVLKGVIAAHAAEKTIDAGEALAAGAPADAEEAAAEARKLLSACEILNALEEGKMEAKRLELTVG